MVAVKVTETSAPLVAVQTTLQYIFRSATARRLTMKKKQARDLHQVRNNTTNRLSRVHHPKRRPGRMIVQRWAANLSFNRWSNLSRWLFSKKSQAFKTRLKGSTWSQCSAIRSTCRKTQTSPVQLNRATISQPVLSGSSLVKTQLSRTERNHRCASRAATKKERKVILYLLVLEAKAFKRLSKL